MRNRYLARMGVVCLMSIGSLGGCAISPEADKNLAILLSDYPVSYINELDIAFPFGISNEGSCCYDCPGELEGKLENKRSGLEASKPND